MNHRQRQRGLTITGFIFVAIIGVVAVMVGARTTMPRTMPLYSLIRYPSKPRVVVTYMGPLKVNYG